MESSQQSVVMDSPPRAGTTAAREAVSTRGARDARALGLVSSAHFTVDTFSNMYAPLLPLLIPRLGLSLAAAGGLAMAFQAAASLSQVGFGRLADRWRPRVLLVGGPFLAALMLSLLGFARSRLELGFLLVGGGLGVAAFHPPGAMLAYRSGGHQPGFAMSVFVTSGTLGFAMAPLVVAPLAEHYGLHATAWLMGPGLLVFLCFLWKAPAMPSANRAHGRKLSELRPVARPLGLLYSVVVLRTMATLSFATFVPVLLTEQGMSVSQAGRAVALYLFACGIGGFWGGTLADRFGPRRVIIISLVAATPFVLTSLLFDRWTFALLLAVGGCFLQSTQPVNVSFAQTLAPRHAATVSSLMMGAAWGMGGILAPATGWVGDQLGLRVTLFLLGLLPLVAAACAARLPEDRRVHAPARSAEVGVAEPAGTGNAGAA
ncbi:MAG: MFS transporter [Luteitalea sp.]|nr:MFS transporter [Luteitalea sp.]